MASLSIRRACAAGVLIACALHTRPLVAQQVLLPLDDIAYTYIDALQMRGMLRSLPALERPYTVGAVRDAVREARGRLARSGVEGWLEAVVRATEKYAPSRRVTERGVFGAGVGLYSVAQTSGNRDLMQSDRVNTLAPGVTVRALLTTGPFTVAMRTIADRQMRADPEFLGRRDRVVAARAEDAYVGVSSKYASAQFGRVGRSWALPGQLGLTVSNGAYTYDHLNLRIGSDKVHLSTVIARLDDERLNFTTDTLAQRYFTAHRLGFALGSVEAGISESVIYGGVGRGFSPTLANPAAPLFVAQYSDAQTMNVAFGADLLWRARSGVRLGAQVHVDDFQIDRCELCGEPPGVAVTMVADGVPLAAQMRGFASYTRVTSLTYRAPDRFERYTSRTVGLGQRNSDFDEWRVGVDLGPLLPAPVRATLAFRRQGAGDYREPFPSEDRRSGWPMIFEGVVVKTMRAAVSGGYRLRDGIEMTADGGFSWIANERRNAGVSLSRFDGRIRVAIEPRWGRATLPID